MPRCLAPFRTVLAVALLFCLSLPLMAQTVSAPTASPMAVLRGTTLDGQAFDLARMRDKVVLLVFWSTECAVCRDKMPELRANVKGWSGQPFEVVGISTDRDRRALTNYQQLVNLAIPASGRFTTLWRGESGHLDSFGPTGALPAAFLIDKQGRVVESYHGRIPPETWDRIAELL